MRARTPFSRLRAQRCSKLSLLLAPQRRLGEFVLRREEIFFQVATDRFVQLRRTDPVYLGGGPSRSGVVRHLTLVLKVMRHLQVLVDPVVQPLLGIHRRLLSRVYALNSKAFASRASRTPAPSNAPPLCKKVA